MVSHKKISVGVRAEEGEGGCYVHIMRPYTHAEIQQLSQVRQTGGFCDDDCGTISDSLTDI